LFIITVLEPRKIRKPRSRAPKGLSKRDETVSPIAVTPSNHVTNLRTFGDTPHGKAVLQWFLRVCPRKFPKVCPRTFESSDKLFDMGYISFADTREIVYSSYLAPSDRTLLGMDDSVHLLKIDAHHLPYLKYHRDNCLSPPPFFPRISRHGCNNYGTIYETRAWDSAGGGGLDMNGKRL